MKSLIQFKIIITIMQLILFIKAKEEIKINNKEKELNSNMTNSFLNKNDTILINKGEIYYNSFVKNEVVNYKLDLSGKDDIVKIEIEIMIFVGDIGVTKYFDLNVVENYVGNKLYLEIYTENKKVNELNFALTAFANSYYSIQGTSLNKNSVDLLIQKDLTMGIANAIVIQDTYKIVKFQRENFMDKKPPIMFSFYSLNCILKAEFNYFDNNNNTITEYAMRKASNKYFSNYVIIDSNNENDKNKYSNEMVFKINIEENDKCDYERKVCKLYASALELYENVGMNNTGILLPDNTPQNYMFRENTKRIPFRYVHVDVQSDIVIKFNPKDPAEYKITIYYGDKKREKEETIISKDILYLNHLEWYGLDICKPGTKTFNIRIDITLQKSEEINPILLFSIKSLSTKSFSYIPKSILTLDYTQNDNSQYFYTELGRGDKGFITVNFRRSYGNIHARIIERVPDEPEDYENNELWRGRYVIPDANNAFSMEERTKILKFSTYDNNCTVGCYLLICVYPKDSNELNTIKNYPFSIIVQHRINEGEKNIPIISIPINEYVYGAVEEKENITYSVYLNENAERVIIDFQSKTPCISINVGKERPVGYTADFQFCSKGDSIFIIKKSEILSLTGGEGLKGVTLIFNIWTENIELDFSSPYVFAFRLDNDTIYDINRVNSDQKVLCKTKLIDKEESLYRCLYVIEYDFISELNKLIVHSMVLNNGVINKGITPYIYANFINQTDYELNSEVNIRKLIPNKYSHHLSNNLSIYDFLFLNEGLKDKKYLLVSVETNSEIKIGLISSFNSHKKDFPINPSTPQLFFGFYHKNMTLIFPNNKKKVAYLYCLGGSAEIYWDDKDIKQYYLNGKDDIIAITSENSDKLNFYPTSAISDEFGFIFYIFYIDRPKNNFNIDPLLLDNTIYYSYTGKDFPISFFTEMKDSNFKEKYFYDIFFSFDVIENEDNFYQYDKKIPFELGCRIVNDKNIYNLLKNPEYFMDNLPIEGKYDPGLKTGFIRISNEHLAEFIETDQIPYLYLKITSVGDFKWHKYKTLALEVSAIYNKPESPVSDLANIFGRLAEGEKERMYKLRANDLSSDIKIKFSCSNYSLSLKNENHDDLKLQKEEYGRQYYTLEKGKLFYTIIVSRNETNKEKTSKEEFFMFQYYYPSPEEKELFISNSTLDIKTINNTKEKCDLSITLYPVQNTFNQEINYIIRVINDAKGYNPDKEEILLSFNQDQYIIEFHNPKVVGNKIEFELKNISKPIKLLQVIAQVNDKEKIEFLSYKLADLEKMGINENSGGDDDDDDDDDDDKKFLILLITIGVFLSIIIGVLAYVIVIYKKKNKGLLDQVNKVSFQLERDSRLNPGTNKNFNDNDEILLNKNS